MLLDAIIIVVRESLEAGVLISVMLAMLNRDYPVGWIVVAFLLGIAGSILYLFNLEAVSSWFEYVGQEVINAAIQYLIFFILAVLLVIRLGERGRNSSKLIPLAVAAVALALIREGVEILVFFSGFLATEEGLTKPLTSGFVGFTIGACVGAFVYYLQLPLKGRTAAWYHHIFLTLIAAGMVSQATQLLLQADWLPTSLPLWNTNGVLAEQSTLGMFAYAVFGYESTPTALEVTFYWSALAVLIVSQGTVLALRRARRKSVNEHSYA